MNTLQVMLAMLMLLIGLPAFFAGALTWINRQTKLSLAIRFGPASEVYWGFLGIMIHELSHLLLAIVFGHHITSFKLVQLPQSLTDQERDIPLGYVNHTWNQRNFYQAIGNLFIGIAPIFGNSVALWGLTKLLWPGLAQALTSWALHWPNYSITFFWHALVNQSVSWWQLILLFLLSINIIVGGFDLSPADIQNSALGLWAAIVTIILISGIWNYFVPQIQLVKIIGSWLGPIYFLLSLAVLLSLSVMLVSLILRKH